jgi:membrane dipeptidase
MKTSKPGPASALIIDTHADTPQRLLDDEFDLAGPLNGGHFNFEAAKQGKLGAEFFAIWAEPKLHHGRYVQRTLDLIDAVHRQAEKHPGRMRMAYSPDDVLAAHQENKLAVLMGIEGGHSIDHDLHILRNYYRLGARYMTLTWSNSNGWADSSGDETDPNIPHTENGLSVFGEQVISEMNRLGMIVDVSHVSDQTFYRALGVTRAPVIASHSCARALCDSPRNLSDDMLRAVADNDGAVMVAFYSAFLSDDFRKASLSQKPERDRATQAIFGRAKSEDRVAAYSELSEVDRAFAGRIPRPPFSILIDHIDHIAKVAGIDHVGIGSDFDGIPAMPEGIDSAADLPKITAALVERGYTATDCDKILGSNFLRVFREVEMASKQSRSE